MILTTHALKVMIMKTTRDSLTRIWMLAILLFAGAFSAAAADFMVDSICYNIIGDNEVEVTKLDSASYSGEVIIPATVVYNDTTYQVTRIGYSAFQGSRNLSSGT